MCSTVLNFTVWNRTWRMTGRVVRLLIIATPSAWPDRSVLYPNRNGKVVIASRYMGLLFWVITVGCAKMGHVLCCSFNAINFFGVFERKLHISFFISNFKVGVLIRFKLGLCILMITNLNLCACVLSAGWCKDGMWCCKSHGGHWTLLSWAPDRHDAPVGWFRHSGVLQPGPWVPAQRLSPIVSIFPYFFLINE